MEDNSIVFGAAGTGYELASLLSLSQQACDVKQQVEGVIMVLSL